MKITIIHYDEKSEVTLAEDSDIYEVVKKLRLLLELCGWHQINIADGFEKEAVKLRNQNRV